MTQIVDSTKRLSNIRKYPVEYAVLALVVAVIYLFSLYVKMNEKLNDKLIEQLEKTTSVIEKNTLVIQQHIK